MWYKTKRKNFIQYHPWQLGFIFPQQALSCEIMCHSKENICQNHTSKGNTWSIIGINPIARARRKEPGTTGSYARRKCNNTNFRVRNWKIWSYFHCGSHHICLKGCYLHQYQDIHRITVFANGSWDETIVVWINNRWVENTINLFKKSHGSVIFFM